MTTSKDKSTYKVNQNLSSDSFEDTNDDDYQIVSQKKWPMKGKRTQEVTENLRVLMPDIVFVSDLPKQLNTESIIMSQPYFGKYGKVTKVIISSKHSSYEAKNHNIQAYITYEDEKDAALAIRAINNFNHSRYFIKATYGASRYCSYFIRGEKCLIHNCIFLHEMRENNETKDVLKNSYMKQNNRAAKILCKNITYFVKKQYNQFVRSKSHKFTFIKSNGIDVIFPSIKCVLEKLIDKNFLKEETYLSQKQKLKAKLQIKNTPPKKNELNDTKQNQSRCSTNTYKQQSYVKSIFEFEQNELDNFTNQIINNMLCEKYLGQDFPPIGFLDIIPNNIKRQKSSKKLNNSAKKNSGTENQATTTTIEKKIIEKIFNKKPKIDSPFTFTHKIDCESKRKEDKRLKQIIEDNLLRTS